MCQFSSACIYSCRKTLCRRYINVKEIYRRNKKRGGRSRYPLSVLVDVEKDGETTPAKLVYVRNKGNRKDSLVLISTDTQLSEEALDGAAKIAVSK